MADPTLPQLTVDTTLPDLSGYTTVTVPGTYPNLQTAINTVPLGTIISLTAATEYSTSGAFGSSADFGICLKNKTTGTGWIIIETAGCRTSGWLPAAGTRLDGPSLRANMARIARLAATNGAVGCENGAHHYRFIGVEFQNAGNTESGFSTESNYLTLDTYQTGTTSAHQPHHIIVDRCYIHGPGTAQSVLSKNGVVFGGSYLAVIDSYIDDLMNSDGESHAIVGWNGVGPLKLDNNFICAAGENLLFGGADPYVASDIVADVTVTKNYFFKKLKWRDNTAYTTGANRVLTKNLFEIKFGKRWLIEGNVFENNWVNGQQGHAIAFSPIAGGVDTPATAYTTIQDITFRKNIVKNSSVGFLLKAGGIDYYTPEGPSIQGGRWRFEDNLIQGLGDPLNGVNGGDRGRLVTIEMGPYDLQFLNNTVVYATNPDAAYTWRVGYDESSSTVVLKQKMTRLVVQNNIFHAGALNLIAYTTSFAAGTDWLEPAAPSYTWDHNLAIGPWPTPNEGNQPTYPVLLPSATNPNWYAGTSDTEAGYTNAAGGVYSLSASSLYHAGNARQGSDGTDVGVDWTTLTTATAGTVTGIWDGSTPPPPPPPVTGTREYAFVRIG